VILIQIVLFILQGFDNLVTRISRLASLKPIAVSITWGAGGSTKERSLELAAASLNDHGLDTILHLTCTNMEKGAVDSALRVRCLKSSLRNQLTFITLGSKSQRDKEHSRASWR
jgi:5,10-methylenetetrahydrofolate reductase